MVKDSNLGVFACENRINIQINNIKMFKSDLNVVVDNNGRKARFIPRDKIIN